MVPIMALIVVFIFYRQRQRSGDDPRAVLDRCAACGRVCIAAACGSYPATPCSPHSFSSCFPEIIHIIGALAKDITVVATRAPTSAKPTISSSESNFLFVAVAHRMRDNANMIRNHFLRIATNRRYRVECLSIVVFSANVTGQGTRHLVAGTLHPFVGGILFIRSVI